MGFIVSGIISTVIGAFLAVTGHSMENDYAYRLDTMINGGTYMGNFLYITGIILIVLGVMLFFVGIVRYTMQGKQSSNNNNIEADERKKALKGPFSCVKCGAQVGNGDFVCPKCKYDNALTFFRRNANAELSAAELNMLWYNFRLDKKFRAETKDLLTLVQKERTGGRSFDRNSQFLHHLDELG